MTVEAIFEGNHGKITLEGSYDMFHDNIIFDLKVQSSFGMSNELMEDSSDIGNRFKFIKSEVVQKITLLLEEFKRKV